MILDSFPRTSSGKIDRLALPNPDSARPELKQAYVEPSSPIEEILADIWAKVLGLDEVGIHDNFFELGGNSIRAGRVLARILESFQIKLPLKDFLNTPTVAGLASFVFDKLVKRTAKKECAGLN